MSLEVSKLVVLAVGLALRDILAVQFQEDDEEPPEDMPSWMSTSPLKLSFLHKVLDSWEIHLKKGEEDEASAEEPTRGRTRSGQKEKKKEKAKQKSKEMSSDSNKDGNDQRP